jgi:hypothetical protein
MVGSYSNFIVVGKRPAVTVDRLQTASESEFLMLSTSNPAQTTAT